MKGQENMKNQLQNNFKRNHKTHKTLKTVLIVTGCVALGLGAFVGGALYGYQEAVKAMKKNGETITTISALAKRRESKSGSLALCRTLTER